jgi:hypothetical protein
MDRRIQTWTAASDKVHLCSCCSAVPSALRGLHNRFGGQAKGPQQAHTIHDLATWGAEHPSPRAPPQGDPGLETPDEVRVADQEAETVVHRVPRAMHGEKPGGSVTGHNGPSLSPVPGRNSVLALAVALVVVLALALALAFAFAEGGRNSRSRASQHCLAFALAFALAHT